MKNTISLLATIAVEHGERSPHLISFALLSLLALAPLAHAQSNRPSGTVVSWGERFLPAVEPGTRFTAIAAGARRTVALTSNGSVVAWGADGYRQARRVPVAAQSGVVAIAAGYFHIVALKSDGSIVAWGRDNFGLTNVPLAAKSGVVAIAAGFKHTLALKTNGAVVAWGDNTDGQTDVPVAAQSGVAAIAAGWFHTVALKTNGSILAWGEEDFSQTTVPVVLPPAIAIAAGGRSTVVLVRDPAASLTLLRNADQTTSLSWRGAGALEQAASLTAPNWQPAPNQANPQPITTTGAMKFFRVKADWPTGYAPASTSRRLVSSADTPRSGAASD